MEKIKAKIVADSINQQGDRITTYLLTFPRFILSELNTHRMFSKNSASSRAIPFEKVVKMVETVPFIPIAWQKDHKGMQGNEYFTGVDIETNNKVWIQARDNAIRDAVLMNQNKVTKQLCNRLLEPFMWHTVLLTATEFENFFNLRCPQYEYYDMLTGNQQFFKSKKDWIQYYNNKPLPKAKHISKIPENDVEWLQINKSQAEIHMQALAEAMWDAMNESTPKKLQAGEWHIPFKDSVNDGKAAQAQSPNTALGLAGLTLNDVRIKISTARCARLSYMTFDGIIDYEKDIKLHDSLLASHHMSPFEHCARAMSGEEYYSLVKGQVDSEVDVDGFINIEGHTNLNVFGWCNNFRGFIQYRHLLEQGKF